jgi:hypothetical protein
VSSFPSPARSVPVRILIGALTLVAAIVVGRTSLAMALVSRDPAAVLKIDPGLPAALAWKAFTEISQSPTRAGARRGIIAGRAALNRDPMSASAAADLGLAVELAGDRTAATKLIQHSEALSRRNLIAQLWLIEYWVAKGDVRRTLLHYDTAMRTSTAAPGLLFPVLVTATGDPAIITPLAHVLAKQPQWSSQYVQQLVQSGTALPNIVQLFIELKRAGKPAAGQALSTLIDRLVAVNSYDAAARLYAAYRQPAATGGIQDGDFQVARPEPTAFDWNFPGTEGLSADILEGAMHLTGAPATGGVVARQLVRLRPGAHLIRGETMGFAGVGENQPYVILKCATGGSELGRATMVPSEEARRFDWLVAVPAGCATQLLEVVLQPVEEAGGVEGQINRLTLVR